MPQGNSLGFAPINQLLRKFCIPTVIMMVVGSLYNMVDQIFIGQGIGLLGNAATNVAFPITTVVLAISVMLGIGGSANFNLLSGQKKEEEAKKYLGCSFTLQVVISVVLMLIVLIFLRPILKGFGATESVLPYAVTYTWITALGIPLYVISQSGTHLIRSDGAPTFSMACGITGAILNLILDPLFIFVFKWGIAGAAWATVIGQVVAGLMVIYYFIRKAHVRLKFRDFVPSAERVWKVIYVGMGGLLTEIFIAVTQIIMNNVVRKYGPLSVYGAEIPLAVVGIITKVNMVYTSIGIGIHQGCQPLFGFNYGAKNYERVKETYKKAALVTILVGVVFFLVFELFPRPIISIFGGGSEEYFMFAERFFRIFLMFTIFNGIPLFTSGFFTAIRKMFYAVGLPALKQILTFTPLLIFVPMVMGIDGILVAGPVSDFIVIVASFICVAMEFKRLDKQIIERDAEAMKTISGID